MLDNCFSTNLMRCDSLSIVSPLCMNLQVVNFRRWEHAFLLEGGGGWKSCFLKKRCVSMKLTLDVGIEKMILAVIG